MTAAVEARRAVISPAELRVLHELVKDGARNGVIAARLGLSEDTVKCHVKKLLEKTGCDHRTELVVDVLRDRVSVTVATPLTGRWA